MKRVTASEARALLNYDPETGVLSWKRRERERFATEQKFKAWNTRYAGKPAGCVSSSTGYLVMSIHNRRELVHRVIWIMQTGEWPPAQVDHQDHCRTNNRWANLRAASHAENGRNQSARRHSASGVLGVSMRRDTGKWAARIKVGGKTKNLGCYATLSAAQAVRQAAAREAGFHDSHGASL